MRGSRAIPDGFPLEWLLEDECPTVRFLALTDILGRPLSHVEVIQARNSIMETGPVPRILNSQSPGGFWGTPGDFYVRSKYKGTSWNLLFLAELFADGDDARIKRACEFMLDNSQDPGSGGFSWRSADGGGGDHDRILPCLTANMAWCLIRFGYLDDPRLRLTLDWLTTYRRYDDGDSEPPDRWPFSVSEKCWGRHTCLLGVVKALKAFREIPSRRRTSAIKNAISDGAEFLMKHRIYHSSHDPERVTLPEWTRFGFPLMWNSDALESLLILTGLGFHDGRMRDAVDLVASKQGESGRWMQENRYSGRFLISLERNGRPSKYVTVNSVTALREFYG